LSKWEDEEVDIPGKPQSEEQIVLPEAQQTVRAWLGAKSDLALAEFKEAASQDRYRTGSSADLASVT